jgi:hypothetical protein
MYRSCLQIFVIARSCPMFRSRSAGSCPRFMTSVECPHLAQIQFCVRHTSLHLGEKNFYSSQNHAHVCSMPICCGSHTGGWCGAGGNMQKDPSLVHRSTGAILANGQGHRFCNELDATQKRTATLVARWQGVRPPQGTSVLWQGAAGGPPGHHHGCAQLASLLQRAAVLQS